MSRKVKNWENLKSACICALLCTWYITVCILTEFLCCLAWRIDRILQTYCSVGRTGISYCICVVVYWSVFLMIEKKPIKHCQPSLIIPDTLVSFFSCFKWQQIFPISLKINFLVWLKNLFTVLNDWNENITYIVSYCVSDTEWGG